MRICIFGASGRELDERYYTEAEALGELIGRNGDSIVFGGGAEGLMGACARGVHSAGGGIIGIAPRFFDEPGILYDKCSRMIFTETMRERKQAMQDNSDACIVLPGGIGTLEEFFELLTLKQLGRDDRAFEYAGCAQRDDKHAQRACRAAIHVKKLPDAVFRCRNAAAGNRAACRICPADRQHPQA